MSKKLSSRTVAELKLLAKEQGIDISGLKKAQIVEVLEADGAGENVITSASIKPNGVSTTSAATNDNGVLVSPQPERVKTTPKPENPINDGKIAVHSTKNLSWTGVGKLDKGYNFITKEAAEKWLAHSAVREATPEEVATHFGVN